MSKKVSVRRKPRRSFTQAFKLAAVQRMATTESIVGLADELGVQCRMLYNWRNHLQAGGAAALRRAGRPSRGDAAAIEAPAAPADLTDTAAARRRIEELERKVGQQQLELDFFSRGLAACQGATPEAGRSWRDNIYTVIHVAMQRQGNHVGIERMCAMAGVSRAGYYRHWLASKPREEETALRDEIQRLSLVHRKNGYRHNGYRQITVLLHHAGWAVNHKRVARIRREDNLLCVPKLSFRPPTTDQRHGWRV